jgi:hypothetical protein
MRIDLYNRLLRDPDTDGGNGDDNVSDEAKALEAALLEEGDANVSKPDSKPADKPSDKGDNKGGDKSGAADDPEEDIEVTGEDGKPQTIKVKRSELKKGYLRQDDYTKKTQRLSEIEKNQKDLIETAEAIRQNPKLAKVFVGLIQNAIKQNEKGEGYYDEAFIDKQLAILDNVAASPGDTKSTVEDKQEDIEKLLEGVDPESPIAKALRATFKANKDIMAKLKGFEEGQSKITKTIGEKEAKEQEAQYNALVEQAGKVLNSTIDDLADETKGGLAFFTQGEKQEWRWKTVAFLRDNPVAYKDDKEFVQRVNDVGKAVHAAMIKYREEILAQQLQKPKTKQEEPKKETTSAEATSLEADILKELEAIDAKT